jgi:hypothetical protein
MGTLANELEQHPYIYIGEAIPARRMIVGTFPIYSLTNPRTPRKIQLQQHHGDISFFYGSQANAFWSWYQQFVDLTVNTQNAQSILTSLQVKEIAISDVIKECSRIDESFEDNKLRRKDWNLPLGNLINRSIDKIICTSKAGSGAMGWLRDKVLMPAGFVVNQTETTQLHQYILNAIPGSNTQVLSIAQVLTRGQKKISIVALPSPGSPERRLVDFGYVDGVHFTATYLQSYLTQTFSWFLQ